MREKHKPLKPKKVESAEFCLAEMLITQKRVKEAVDQRVKAHRKLPLSLKLSLLADAIIMEGAELKAVLPWKLWKGDYGRDLEDGERDEVVEELVDILHFVLEGFIDLGIDDPRVITGLYLAKADINQKRQKDDY